MSDPRHVPVLRDETVALLQPGPGRRIVDGTFGMGGHALELLAAGAEVLGLDLDPDASAACLALAAERSGLRCQRRSFRDLDAALDAAGWADMDGLLLDLGVSSLQIDAPDKGFTYRVDAPLDLRFDPDHGESAAALLARLDRDELADLIWRWGEERGSRRIARAIVAARDEGPVATSAQLREIVTVAAGRGPHLNATLSRVFQALRIVVNDELGALAEVLDVALRRLAPGGRLVVIAYHSLEDRIVKQWLQREARDCLCEPNLPTCRCGHRRSLKILTRKPVAAAAAELERNPRARSARLRAGERLAS
jgi:16S rRNA (cytosine1402-N4)-methyltransferase